MVSQVALDQSITKRQQTDKKVKRSEIYLEMQMHCISNFISNYTLPILVQ